MSASKVKATTDWVSDNIHLRQEQLLKYSPHAEQLRRVGLDLFNENSKLVGRVRALEQALEEEKASVRLLKAMRDAGRQQQRDSAAGKRKASLGRFVVSKRREIVVLEDEREQGL
ncbi:hypothetical protein LTR85_008388 [Meristemomyces frigidus]|nr:hypothetical protein LTR85_008388 [Meristemomyces frigidus]